MLSGIHIKIVSEAFCEWVGLKHYVKDGDLNNLTEYIFNAFIINNVSQPELKYHYAPQYDYVYNSKTGEKITKNVIQFENFQEDLKQLFLKFNIEIDIPNKKINASKKYLIIKIFILKLLIKLIEFMLMTLFT